MIQNNIKIYFDQPNIYPLNGLEYNGIRLILIGYLSIQPIEGLNHVSNTTRLVISVFHFYYLCTCCYFMLNENFSIIIREKYSFIVELSGLY